MILRVEPEDHGNGELARMIDENTNCPEDFPKHLWEGFRRYVLDGIPPGGGLLAFLRGDLFDLFQRGDFTEQLTPMVRYLQSDCPSGCFGSRERVQDWLAAGGLRGSYTE